MAMSPYVLSKVLNSGGRRWRGLKNMVQNHLNVDMSIFVGFWLWVVWSRRGRLPLRSLGWGIYPRIPLASLGGSATPYSCMVMTETLLIFHQTFFSFPEEPACDRCQLRVSFPSCQAYFTNAVNGEQLERTQNLIPFYTCFNEGDVCRCLTIHKKVLN